MADEVRSLAIRLHPGNNTPISIPSLDIVREFCPTCRSGVGGGYAWLLHHRRVDWEDPTLLCVSGVEVEVLRLGSGKPGIIVERGVKVRGSSGELAGNA